MPPPLPPLAARHARRIHVKAFVIALALWTVVPASPRSASAQTPSDSIPADSVPTRSSGNHPDDPLLLVGMAAAAVILTFAPATGVLIAAPMDTSVKLTWLLRDHTAVRVAAGQSAEPGQTWTYSLDLEILRGSWFGEARLENFHVPHHFQYQSIGAGYLFRYKRGIAAGPLVGYRRAPRDRRQDGFYVGLPYMMDAGGGVLRFETTYVLSSGRPTWNYRWLAEFPIGKGPFSFGLAIDAKSLPMDASDDGVFASSFGLHLVRRM